MVIVTVTTIMRCDSLVASSAAAATTTNTTTTTANTTTTTLATVCSHGGELARAGALVCLSGDHEYVVFDVIHTISTRHSAVSRSRLGVPSGMPVREIVHAHDRCVSGSSSGSGSSSSSDSSILVVLV